jgi:hypothetical protein
MQPDTQLKSSMAQNASWLPIALSTSSEQPLVQVELLKLYDIEPRVSVLSDKIENE